MNTKLWKAQEFIQGEMNITYLNMNLEDNFQFEDIWNV